MKNFYYIDLDIKKKTIKIIVFVNFLFFNDFHLKHKCFQERISFRKKSWKNVINKFQILIFLLDYLIRLTFHSDKLAIIGL